MVKIMVKKDWDKQFVALQLAEQDRLRNEIIKLRKLLNELEAKWQEMPAEGGETDENTNNSDHTVLGGMSPHRPLDEDG